MPKGGRDYVEASAGPPGCGRHQMERASWWAGVRVLESHAHKVLERCSVRRPFSVLGHLSHPTLACVQAEIRIRRVGQAELATHGCNRVADSRPKGGRDYVEASAGPPGCGRHQMERASWWAGVRVLESHAHKVLERCSVRRTCSVLGHLSHPTLACVQAEIRIRRVGQAELATHGCNRVADSRPKGGRDYVEASAGPPGCGRHPMERASWWAGVRVLESHAHKVLERCSFGRTFSVLGHLSHPTRFLDYFAPMQNRCTSPRM